MTIGVLLAGCAEKPATEDNVALADAAALEGISLAISKPQVTLSSGFRSATAQAALSHPGTKAAQNAILRNGYAVDEVRGALAPQISGQLYAGLSSEGSNGVGAAARVNFSKILYDGGEIDNRTVSAQLGQRVAYEDYRGALNDNLLEAATAWVTLREATRLSGVTQERLRVVRPLFSQVETVAQSGVVDKTIVSAARRLVNDIREAEVDTRDQLRQARTNFKRAYGKLPGSTGYDAGFVARRTAGALRESEILIAPPVVRAFLQYQQSLADLEVAKAGKGTDIRLEADASEPLDTDDTTDGSRSLGIVFNRTFYDGNQTEARINQAAVRVVESRDVLQDAYRDQAQQAFRFRESLDSIGAAMAVSREGLGIAREEVGLLRQQLAIGQSTLDDVLEAEVRLYRAETELIVLDARRDRLRLNLLASLGRLPEAFGLREAEVLDRFMATGAAQ